MSRKSLKTLSFERYQYAASYKFGFAEDVGAESPGASHRDDQVEGTGLQVNKGRNGLPLAGRPGIFSLRLRQTRAIGARTHEADVIGMSRCF